MNTTEFMVATTVRLLILIVVGFCLAALGPGRYVPIAGLVVALAAFAEIAGWIWIFSQFGGHDED